MRRAIPTVGVLLVIAALVALFQFARRFDPDAAGAGNRGMAGDVAVRLEDATIIARNAGVRQWSVRADRIDLRRGRGDGLDDFAGADLAGLRDGILMRRGSPEATFSARQAVYQRATGRLDITGRIRLRSNRGDTLASERIEWSERDDFVRLPAGGHGTFRGHRVQAPVLLFSPRRNLVQCPTGAKGTFQGYPLQVEQLYWDLEAQTVWCPGNVTGERRTARFAARDVRLDLKRRHLSANAGTAAIRMEGEDLEVGGW